MPFKSLLVSILLLALAGQSTLADSHIPVDAMAIKFVELIIMPPELLGDPLQEISENWENGYVPMLIEILSLSEGASLSAARITAKQDGSEYWSRYEPVV